MFRSLDRKKINVVYDNDLPIFLKRLGVYSDIESGVKKCKFTGQAITLKNFYSVFEESGDVKFVSDSPESVRLFSEFLNHKK